MPQKSIFDLFGEKSPARMVTVKLPITDRLSGNVFMNGFFVDLAF